MIPFAYIAFLGRSNVGKSSLLNALTRNWGVARTSDKPGLTQVINGLCYRDFSSFSGFFVLLFFGGRLSAHDNCASFAEY